MTTTVQTTLFGIEIQSPGVATDDQVAAMPERMRQDYLGIPEACDMDLAITGDAYGVIAEVLGPDDVLGQLARIVRQRVDLEWAERAERDPDRPLY